MSSPAGDSSGGAGSGGDRSFDVIVLGAGPAGANAALAAAAAGARVLVVEEAPEAGGQVWRAPAPGLARKGPGEALRRALAAAPVTRALGHRVWMVSPGYRVDAVGPDGAVCWRAPALIACTGTHERIIPFPGWTEPGVIGLAGATILLKANALLPGRRVLVAGAGPLLPAVAAGVQSLGGRVAGIVDLAAPAAWARALPGMAARPDLLLEGAGWVARLAARRVPWYFRHAVVAVGRDRAGLLSATVAPVDRDGLRRGGRSRVITADAVAVGHGLVPDTGLTRLLRAAHDWAPALGGWVPRLDPLGQTSLPGLFVAGDGAGVRGAAAATLHGRIAGLGAAAHALGQAVDARDLARLRRRHARASRFGAGFAGMVGPRDRAIAAIAPETIVCRCESLRRADLERALDDGAGDLDQLKQWTRCGMGPCQGRFCGETAAALLVARGVDRRQVRPWTGRAPLRPVDLAAVIGSFSYDDIPIPPPAPL